MSIPLFVSSFQDTASTVHNVLSLNQFFLESMNYSITAVIASQTSSFSLSLTQANNPANIIWGTIFNVRACNMLLGDGLPTSISIPLNIPLLRPTTAEWRVTFATGMVNVQTMLELYGQVLT